MARPNGFWRDLVLNALDSLGGEAGLPDIIDAIEGMTELAPHEVEIRWGRPRYVQNIRTVAARLAREGRIARVRVGRGRYRLIPGREAPCA